MEISRQIARYVTRVSFASIPDDVVQFAKRCILDYFSSAIAGRNMPPLQMIAHVIAEMGGNEQATLMNGKKSTILHAALFNGASSHIVELDDIHKASIVHGATVIIPPALAVSEWQELSGKELIEAVVCGYEIAFRVGETVSPSHYFYFHNTATCGTFGAAVASAKLLKLNEEQMVMTLGSAGTQAAGLWEFIEDGTMSKQLHTGKAAQNGLLSALLAARGFTGATHIFEGRRGFVRAMSNAEDFSPITARLGETYKIIENSFKIHASCRHTHAAIDLALMLYAEELDLEKVQHIAVHTYQVAIDITDNPTPQTVYEAKFSMQFCVALALIYGQSDIYAFTEERMDDPAIMQLMRHISLVKDDDIDRQYPEKWGTKLIVTFYDGREREFATDYPKGDPENPVSEDDLVQKFHILAKDMEVATRGKLIDTILNLEDVPNVRELMSIIATS